MHEAKDPIGVKYRLFRTKKLIMCCQDCCLLMAKNSVLSMETEPVLKEVSCLGFHSKRQRQPSSGWCGWQRPSSLAHLWFITPHEVFWVFCHNAWKHTFVLQNFVSFDLSWIVNHCGVLFSNRPPFKFHHAPIFRKPKLGHWLPFLISAEWKKHWILKIKWPSRQMISTGKGRYLTSVLD